MQTRCFWLAVLGLVCSLGVGRLAAFPTDTLVVASTGGGNESPSTTLEPTTEEMMLPIKLTEMEVTSNISLRYAHTAVVVHVRNPAKVAQEAHFRVLLPETAFISGFIMTIDGKSYKAYVKEKEEAKQIYKEAVSQGLGAAHINAKARDSNHFTVAVNVEPSSNAIFHLTYEELLTRRNGVYNHAINLHPGTLVPKFTVTVHILESEKITELRTPEIRTGNEIDATKDDAQNTKAVIVRSHDDREATITFKPDLEEQKRLMEIYIEKSKESALNKNHLSLDGDNKAEAEGNLGQFVVQYDVDRTNDGVVLVNDGYFVHFFAPKDLPVLNKYVIFVLDTSGSMMGRKIEQLREAMIAILSELNAGDYFNIVEFASSVTVHDLKEADQEPPKRNYYDYDYIKEAPLVDPAQAKPENIAKAKVIISRLDAIGGTNIAAAFDVAVRLNNKRFQQSVSVVKNNETVPSTTTEVTTTQSLQDETIQTLEPMIIFLTDGEPTVGESDPARIITRLSEQNYGPRKAAIFSLAFGDDADRKFLRKISLRNDGFMRHIYEGADAPLQLRDFYRYVSSPLLANIKFSYPSTQVKKGTTTKDEFRAYYAGSEVVVAGQIEDHVKELTPELSGFCGVLGDGKTRKKYQKNDLVPIPESRKNLPLERLWAYLTIKQLLDQKDAADNSDKADNEAESPKKKALDLALKYEFVTPLTSLVVVKPNMTSAVDAESVDNNKQQDKYLVGGPLSLSHQYLSAPSYYYPAAPIGQTSAFSSSVLDNFEESALVDDYDSDGFTSRLSVYSAPYHLSSRSSLSSFAFAPFQAAIPLTFDSIPSTRSSYMGSNVRVTSLVSADLPEASTDLGAYHLEKFPWTHSILNPVLDALALQLNETVYLKLTKETNAPKDSTGDAACSNPVNGDDGLCVYLTRCDSAQNITINAYKINYCLVEQSYAGVCCPKKDINNL